MDISCFLALMDMNEEILYMIALTQVPNIGIVNAKKLIEYCGSARNVFLEKKKILSKIHGVGDSIIESLNSKKPLEIAEKEIEYATNNSIRIVSYMDTNYPERLKSCHDSPIVLYIKGNVLPRKEKMLAVVGTRNATEYGRKACSKIISELKDLDAGIVSGLAYGIDTCAHTAALSEGLSTFAVLGTGFKTIYPYTNLHLAQEIADTGSLITEFLSDTKPDRENFPKRNRIIAGISDAVLVIEAANKGGALITANIANSYNREVFAIPGRINDYFSIGCNNLIYSNKALLITSASDIINSLNWDTDTKAKKAKNISNLNPTQQAIYSLISENGTCNVDFIAKKLDIAINKLSFELLDMELNGLISCLPGKNYDCI